MKQGELSETQTRLLEFIRDYLMRRGYAPTLREMVAGVGIPSTSTVSYNLDRLEEMGYLSRRQAGQRAIALTDQAEATNTDLRAVIEDHADNLDLLAAEVYDMDRDTLRRALTARAEGLRAALTAAGVTPC